jgi:hypothetical protein
MFFIEFKTDNDAFAGDQGFINETRAIFENVWEKISKGQKEGAVMDSNGNKVGQFGFTD